MSSAAIVISVNGGGDRTIFEVDSAAFLFTVTNLTPDALSIHNILSAGAITGDQSDGTLDPVLTGFSTCQPSIPGNSDAKLHSCTFTYTIYSDDPDLSEPIDQGKTPFTLQVVAADLNGNTLGTANATFSVTVKDRAEGTQEPSTLSMLGIASVTLLALSRRRVAICSQPGFQNPIKH